MHYVAYAHCLESCSKCSIVYIIYILKSISLGGPYKGNFVHAVFERVFTNF